MIESERTISLPAQECDLLIGLSQIATWLGLSAGQCRQRINNGLIPTFRIDCKPTVYALKSEINAAAQLAKDRFRQRRLPT